MFKLFRKRTAPVSAAEARVLAYNASMVAVAHAAHQGAQAAFLAAEDRSKASDLYGWHEANKAVRRARLDVAAAFRQVQDAYVAANPRTVARDADGLPVMFRFA